VGGAGRVVGGQRRGGKGERAVLGDRLGVGASRGRVVDLGHGDRDRRGVGLRIGNAVRRAVVLCRVGEGVRPVVIGIRGVLDLARLDHGSAVGGRADRVDRERLRALVRGAGGVVAEYVDEHVCVLSEGFVVVY